MTESSSTPRMNIESVIVCNDARQEMNGSFFLIGIYNSILVNRLPIDIPLTYWIQGGFSAPGDIKIRFRLTGPYGASYADGGFTISVSNVDVTSLAFPTFGAMIQHEGEIIFEVAQNDEEFVILKKLKIALRSKVPRPEKSATVADLK